MHKGKSERALCYLTSFTKITEASHQLNIKRGVCCAELFDKQSSAAGLLLRHATRNGQGSLPKAAALRACWPLPPPSPKLYCPKGTARHQGQDSSAIPSCVITQSSLALRGM